MTPAKLFAVAAVGLSAAACSYSNTTTAAAPVRWPYRSGAEQACVDYGFNPGTDSYNRCVVREAAGPRRRPHAGRLCPWPASTPTPGMPAIPTACRSAARPMTAASAARSRPAAIAIRPS